LRAENERVKRDA
jgi:hypothetical protein